MPDTRCASKVHPTAQWQKHCLYIDSDLLECAKHDKSIKILLLEIKKGNAYYFFNQQGIVHHEESQGQTLYQHFYVQMLFSKMQFAINNQEHGSLVHGQCNTMYWCKRPNLCSNFSQISHSKRMSPPVLCRHGSM
jgi:hypothetical protein